MGVFDLQIRKLLDLDPGETLGRGTRLRFRSSKHYEDFSELMVMDEASYDEGSGLVFSRGYNAGFVLVILPCFLTDTRRQLTAGWLQENWEKWVNSEIPASEVFVLPKPEPLGKIDGF